MRKLVVFAASRLPASQMRHRQTPSGKDKIKIRFETAAPGKEFTTDLEAAAHRD